MSKISRTIHLPYWTGRIERAERCGTGFDLDDWGEAQRGYTPIIERVRIEHHPGLHHLSDLTREARLVHLNFGDLVFKRRLPAARNAVRWAERVENIWAAHVPEKRGYKLVRDFECEEPEVYAR